MDIDKKLFDALDCNDIKVLMDLSWQTVQCCSEHHLIDLTGKLEGIIGFDHSDYIHGNLQSLIYNNQLESNILNVSYPDKYLEHYMENGCHKTDKLVCELFSNLSPIHWHTMDQRLGMEYPAAQLALDFNLPYGWTHGTYDPVTMEFSVMYMAGPLKEWTQRHQTIIEYIIPFYTEAYKKVLQRVPHTENDLTEREIEVLHWIKEGKSSWEISVILNCSKRTVNFHVNNIKEKLNVMSRPQAVAIGLQKGLITF